jgi:hypothetical protein
MNKEKRKPKLKKEAEKMFKESHVAVILEDMRDDIKLIAEGLNGTNDRLGRLEGEFHDFKSETRENFRLVFSHFSTIEDELQDIKYKLEKMDENKIDKKEFHLLKIRVEKLEKMLAGKKEKVK